MSDQKNEIETGHGHVVSDHAQTHAQTANREIVGFQSHEAALPKGYYYSWRFLGTCVAGNLAAISGIGGFSFAAPILMNINSAIGPSVDITWAAIVFNLTGAVSMPVCGRAMDIFGRRWTVVCLNLLALLGSVVAATAKNVPSLIVGTALIGLAAPAQTCYNVILGELVPMKHRYTMSGVVFLFAGVPTAFSAAISQGLVQNTAAGWRSVYYMVIALNAAAFFGFLLCYHPPTFEMKHGRESKAKYVRNFDIGGSFLFIAGLSTLLMGLLWGGQRYPWKSAAVIASIVLGTVCLIALYFYESLVPLKEPLFPKHIFKNGEWLAAIAVLGLAASAFYGFSLIWPGMVSTLYATESETINNLTMSLPGLGVGTGGILGSVLAKLYKRTKILATVSFAIGGILLACLATCTPDSRSQAIGLLFCGAVCLGVVETITIAMATLLVVDQRDIGIAGNLGTCSRVSISAVCSAIYTSVLSSRLSTTIGNQVPPALTAAGLDPESIPQFITALTTGTSMNDVPGVTASIIEAGTTAYKWASSDAYRTVSLCTIAFSTIGILTCLFIPDSYKLMTGDLAARLDRVKEVQVGEGETPVTTEKGPSDHVETL
ncbi:hypothetical protein AYO20_07887 [Fonsecaea nubica]|uniref:Major facilitator superfamily (MFS) profile domain-containing protein n=1 Tax=Fonsecaea nubica TaxID=856822 RepID=A0A178CSZ1_9EURO|nr:hypothetical protein AYO20_07887 [Fonsecaea nubica]OAL32577.1 hypothetical protein AYO20_07887 [Fonsecaea nubica]